MPLRALGGLFESLTLYEIYVLLLRTLIAASIVASLIVTAARLLTLLKFCLYAVKAAAWQKPEQAFRFAELPHDAVGNVDRFPMVAVQVRIQAGRSIVPKYGRALTH